MDKVVVSVGGSVLIPGRDDSEYIARLAAVLTLLKSEVQLAVVCGGGSTARYYASTGRELGGCERDLDIMGIGATRLNAQLLGLALGDMPERVCESAEETAAASAPGRIVVMGGTEPGHTTDAVAAMVARAMGADRIVNASNVDHVYTDDPRSNPAAERIDRMTVDRLGELVYKEHGASKSSVFDPMGVDIARESRIDILMVDGRNLDALRAAILGEPFEGTFVDSHRAARSPWSSRPRARQNLLSMRSCGARSLSSRSCGCRRASCRTRRRRLSSSSPCRRRPSRRSGRTGSCGRSPP